MNRHAVLALLAFATSACETTSFELSLKGTSRGQPADFKVHVQTEGMASGTLGNDDPLRDVAPLAIVAGATDTRSRISGQCTVTPCPTVAELDLSSPPPMVYAGRWNAPDAKLTFTDANDARLPGLFFSAPDSHFSMIFEPPVFSNGGTLVATNTGSIDGALVAGGETLAVTGRFNLAFTCSKQSTYYRFCGNTRGADGESNPKHRPYTENTCPAELTAPYEASPTWSGDTLHLGELTVSCRHTEDHPEPILCYQRRTVTAAGCTWDVHFLTDGALQQFAIAAFANEGCATKTCNTYR